MQPDGRQAPLGLEWLGMPSAAELTFETSVCGPARIQTPNAW